MPNIELRQVQPGDVIIIIESSQTLKVIKQDRNPEFNAVHLICEGGQRIIGPPEKHVLLVSRESRPDPSPKDNP